MLEKYLQTLGKLRTDKGRDRYPEITYHRAPHKPFLLLSVMDLIALCCLCHWSFDEGLMSVGVKYVVLVSKRVQIEQNLPGHVLTLRDRHIFTPGENQYWPAQDNLEWHREKSFLR